MLQFVGLQRVAQDLVTEWITTNHLKISSGPISVLILLDLSEVFDNMSILLFPWRQGHHSLLSSSTHLLPSVLATSDSSSILQWVFFQSINYIMSLFVEKPLITSTAAGVPTVLNVQQYWLITQHSSTLHLKVFRLQIQWTAICPAKISYALHFPCSLCSLQLASFMSAVYIVLKTPKSISLALGLCLSSSPLK